MRLTASAPSTASDGRGDPHDGRLQRRADGDGRQQHEHDGRQPGHDERREQRTATPGVAGSVTGDGQAGTGVQADGEDPGDGESRAEDRQLLRREHPRGDHQHEQ